MIPIISYLRSRDLCVGLRIGSPLRWATGTFAVDQDSWIVWLVAPGCLPCESWQALAPSSHGDTLSDTSNIPSLDGNSNRMRISHMLNQSKTLYVISLLLKLNTQCLTGGLMVTLAFSISSFWFLQIGANYMFPCPKYFPSFSELI
jgi:hypothetical protein